MSMRERFSDEEWALARHVPVDAFFMVALSDAKLEEKEIASFADELTHAEGMIDPLHREVAEDLDMGRGRQLQPELEFQAAENAAQMQVRIANTKTLLREKLTQDEYQSFIASAAITGMKAARATGGGGLFHRKETVSDEEKTALMAFITTYELDPSALAKFPGAG